MFPGRFPSPTPSRDTSACAQFEVCNDIFTMTPNRPTGTDFTAPESLRRRPHFAESQSEPIVSRHSKTTAIPTFLSPTPQQRGTDRRRASDPLRGQPGSRIQKCRVATTRPKKQRRAVSNPANLSTSLSSAAIGHLSSPLEADSEPSVSTSCPSARSTDIDLYEKLHEPLNFSDTSGVVYILSDPKRPELGYKIGSTTRAQYKKRFAEYRKCGFVPRVVPGGVSGDILFCVRAEKLAQIDLQDYCQPWDCESLECKVKTHREWFKIDEALAISTVKRWEFFMNTQRPYDSGKKLSAFWTYILEERRLKKRVTDETDHDARRAQWASILSLPTYREYFSFYRHIFLLMWSYILECFWQLATVMYGFITFLVFRNTFAATAFALVLICAFFSLPRPSLWIGPKKMRVKVT